MFSYWEATPAPVCALHQSGVQSHANSASGRTCSTKFQKKSSVKKWYTIKCEVLTTSPLEEVSNVSSVTMNDSVGVSNDTWQWYKEVIRSWLEDPGVEEFEGLNLTALKMDQAYMTGVSETNVGVYSVSDDCFRVSHAFKVKT